MGYGHTILCAEHVSPDTWSAKFEMVRDRIDTIVALSEVDTYVCEMEDCIVIRGVHGEGWEDFVWKRYPDTYTYCGTARQPYDVVIMRILVAIEFVYSDIMDNVHFPKARFRWGNVDLPRNAMVLIRSDWDRVQERQAREWFARNVLTRKETGDIFLKSVMMGVYKSGDAFCLACLRNQDVLLHIISLLLD